MAEQKTKQTDLPKRYDPQEIEPKWYDYWMKGGYFKAKISKNGKPFSIVIPPPNVTGSLHVGHALNNTLQDILIRWRRMQGYDTLWLPGTDHAGIATQVVVERELAKEGKTRHDLGREKFLERVWEWKEKYGRTIIRQLQRLGASCDWSRERFTMDEGCSRAVREVFVRLYEKGLIYRGDYIINWCPRCSTSLSDLEVEHEETSGKLTYIRYPFADGQGEMIVATTRPETMLGDTAVAVHPDDERYRDVIGKTVILPVMEREIPVIADSYVDPAFGTGAVKVTPAHDPNDFEIGLRHNLERITVIGEDGRMTKEAGKFAGMDRYECRKKLMEELEEKGYLIKTEDHIHAVGHCQRCGTVIEPRISKQWFVKMKPLAEPAIEVVKEGKIRFIPERFEKLYLHWMENIRDWCISRQIWWGHRIPAWYCECGEVIVSRKDPQKCPECGSTNLTQDPDVLDTWFSSALWPFSTMGWPEETEDLKYFFPTSVLVTAYDIIFFWVARMIFSSLEHTGKIPFSEVFINGLVRDADGQKMSKSKGTGMDPLEIIEEYGADTLRYSLVTGNTPGNDMRYYPEKVAAARNFLIKVWNASRFALMNLEGFTYEDIDLSGDLELSDRWILSRFNEVAGKVTRHLEEYQIGEATRTLYDFIWSEFCDWYIELTKPRLYGDSEKEKKTARSVLAYVLEGIMRLLHPFVPFLTEEIWQRLPHRGETVMLAPWPEYSEDQVDREAVSQMELLMEVIRGIRNIRGEMNVPPGKKARVIAVARSAEVRDTLKVGTDYIKLLAQADEIEIREDLTEKPEKAATAVVRGAEIYVPLAGLIDIDTEISRLKKELQEVEAELTRAEKKLANENFVKKAPKEIVDRERAKRDDYRERKERLKERLAQLAE